jgi:ABC-2 type transport system permease protein
MLLETWVIFARQLRQQLRNPVWLFFGLTQPLLFLLLFGPLLKGIRGGGLGGAGSYAILVPGLLLQLSIFSGGFAGFGIIQELREGVVDRQRVTPARRLSLIMGRSLCDVATIGVQCVILTLVALPFGLSADAAGCAVAIVLVMVLALGLTSASYAMGLILKDEDSFAPFVQGITMPLMLLSGVLLPIDLGPAWLRNLSDVIPLRHSLDALRSLFRGDFGNDDVLIGTLVTIAVAGLLTWWGARAFQRSSA